MTAVPYAKRKINVSFQLGTGSFGSGTADTITLKDLRIIAQITNAVLPNANELVLQIWGMTLSQMNQLSVAGLQYLNRNNQVKVEAGDDSGMTTVFNGQIIEAYPVMKNLPDAPFVVTASPGPGIALPPVPPVTFNNASVPVETALKQILSPAGLSLENHGVNAVLSFPYFPGTVMTQMLAAIRAARCYGALDLGSKTLAIWPRDGNRGGDAIVISKDTGMIGAPEFEQAKIKVRTLFDPAIKGVGTKFQVKSQLSAANGKWSLTQIDYLLSSELPGGPWEMTLIGPPDKGG